MPETAPWLRRCRRNHPGHHLTVALIGLMPPTNGLVPGAADAAASTSLDQAPTYVTRRRLPRPASSGDVSFWMIALIVLVVVVGVVFWLRRRLADR